MNVMIAARSALRFSDLLGNMPAGIAQGIIWGIMALGLYITYRLLEVSDLSVDGTFTTGGAVTVMLILAGWNPVAAVCTAFIAGMAAGTCTGLLHTVLGIPAILSGILTQFALWSINLAIMGFSANKALNVSKYTLMISSRNIQMAIIIGIVIAVILIGIMYWYFGTEHGSAMRATGCNPEMAKAQGINISVMKVIGLALDCRVGEDPCGLPYPCGCGGGRLCSPEISSQRQPHQGCLGGQQGHVRDSCQGDSHTRRDLRKALCGQV